MTRGQPLLRQQGLGGRDRRRRTRPRRARRERGGLRARCALCGTRGCRGRRAGVGAREGGSARLRTVSCELSGWRRAEDLLKIATLGEECRGRRWEGDGEAGQRAPARRRLGGAGWEARQDPRRERGPRRRRPAGPGGAGRDGRHLGARPRPGGSRPQTAAWGGAEDSSGLQQRVLRGEGRGS